MKTVYILGAGFSVEAGAPTQAKILSKAFELHNNNHSIFDERKFSTFKRFLKNQLNWTPICAVMLNPERPEKPEPEQKEAA